MKYFSNFKNYLSYIFFVIYNYLSKNIPFSREGILLVNTEKLGDNILTLDFLKSISQSKKYTKKYLLIRKDYYNLINESCINFNVIDWDNKKYKFNLIYRVKILRYLRGKKIGTAINITPERGMINDELTLLSGAKINIAIKENTPFINKKLLQKINKQYSYILSSKSINEYKVLEELSEFIDIQSFAASICLKHNYQISEILEVVMSKKFITIAPLASEKMRSWPLNNYRAICKSLSTNYDILLLGTLEQKKDLEYISKNIKGVYNLAGTIELKYIPSVIGSGKLFIGNDSGLTHMAVHLKIPSIAIIGGGKYDKFFPYPHDHKCEYKYYKLDCFGCGWNCIYSEAICITRVSVNEILKSAFKLLDNNL